MAAELAHAMNSRGGRPQIVFGDQVPNSPDTNGCDLGFFKSMDTRLPRSRALKLDAFEKQCLQTFKEYPREVLDKLFQTKTLTCKAIVANGGDNTYKRPHARDFA